MLKEREQVGQKSQLREREQLAWIGWGRLEILQEL